MSNEHIKVILGQEELQKLSQEIACLQDLAMSLQAVGLQVASDKVLQIVPEMRYPTSRALTDEAGSRAGPL